MLDLREVEDRLGLSFTDYSLLERALTHRSYLNENPDYPLEDNERLEFLGDAVLSLVVAEKLYRDFPHFGEGEMTKLRAALVRQDTLSRLRGTPDRHRHAPLQDHVVAEHA